MLMIDGQADVDAWVEQYGYTFPVLADPAYTGSNAIGIGGGIPHHALVGRDMTVRVYGNQPGSGDIEAALAEDWPEVERPEPPVLEGDDDDDDGPSLPEGENPFLIAEGPGWETANLCAASPSARGSWLAAAALLPLLAWRRRRT